MAETGPPEGDLIVFDGECLFCSGFARALVRADKAGRFRFITAQSPRGQGLYRAHGFDPEAMETSLTILDGRAHARLAGIGAAFGALGWPWKAMGALAWLPRPLADPIYNLVARNRYRIAGKRACALPGPEFRGRLIE